MRTARRWLSSSSMSEATRTVWAISALTASRKRWRRRWMETFTAPSLTPSCFAAAAGKAAARGIRAAERATGEHAREELVGQLACGVLGAPFGAKEGVHRRVIGGAELGESGLRGRVTTAGTGDERPASGGEIAGG